MPRPTFNAIVRLWLVPPLPPSMLERVRQDPTLVTFVGLDLGPLALGLARVEHVRRLRGELDLAAFVALAEHLRLRADMRLRALRRFVGRDVVVAIVLLRRLLRRLRVIVVVVAFVLRGGLLGGGLGSGLLRGGLRVVVVVVALVLRGFLGGGLGGLLRGGLRVVVVVAVVLGGLLAAGLAGFFAAGFASSSSSPSSFDGFFAGFFAAGFASSSALSSPPPTASAPIRSSGASELPNPRCVLRPSTNGRRRVLRAISSGSAISTLLRATQPVRPETRTWSQRPSVPIRVIC